MVKKEVIEKFIELTLNPVPVKYGTKIPIRPKHNSVFKKSELEDYVFEEIGISTGYASLNLEALDFDTKNTNDPEAFIKDFESAIPESLLAKLVVQSTPSGGVHYLYRCSTIENNQKLARNKQGAATIETRGIGGYIKCSPSVGYKLISKKTFSEIPYITPEERNLLITICRQMDELVKRDVYKRYSREDLEYSKKFPEYNSDSDIGIGLLEDNGWKYHSTNGDWYNLTRPDSTSGDLHGGYNTRDMFFQVFSTAQDIFEEKRGYNNHHLYAELECGGNYKKAYRQLFDEGFGVDEDEEEDNEELDFVSTYEDENEKLDQLRKGEVPLGMSLGWKSLDQYFKLKKNHFYIFLGLDNIGKSTMLSSIMAATKVLGGEKWGISSPEGAVDDTRGSLIEAESGREIKEFDNDSELYQSYMKSSREHFIIIKNDKHYTIDEILDKGRILYQKYGIDYLLIDPFSFYSGSGNHTDDTAILSKIRVFCQKYCSVIVVDHPFTGFTRVGKSEDGYLKLPTKYDASGGNLKANRCDDFVSFHRIINHSDLEIRRTMQISVQKVKKKSTGGQPHGADEYSKLVYEKRHGFLGYWDEDGNNPMYEHLKSKNNFNKVLRNITPEEAFGV